MNRNMDLLILLTLDFMGIELVHLGHRWSKKLRRDYGNARRTLLRNLGLSVSADVADLVALSSHVSQKRGSK